MFEGSDSDIEADSFPPGLTTCTCRIEDFIDEPANVTLSLSTNMKEAEYCNKKLQLITHVDAFQNVFDCSSMEVDVESFSLRNVTVSLFVEAPWSGRNEYKLTIHGNFSFIVPR